MDCDENLPHFSQRPASSAKVRRSMEVKPEEQNSEKVEWMLGVKTSRPKMSIELCSSVCSDEGFMPHEHDEDGGNYNPGSVYAHVEASQKDLQCGEDKAAAAAEMPNTKPKAGTLVAGRQLIDGSEADQSNRARRLPNTDPKRTFFPPPVDVAESKSRYYKDLSKQVEERKQQTAWERSQNATDAQKHIETMQRSIWGMPGSGAPNYHLGTSRRTNSLFADGILPQEQVRDKGFRGTPFNCL